MPPPATSAYRFQSSPPFDVVSRHCGVPFGFQDGERHAFRTCRDAEVVSPVVWVDGVVARICDGTALGAAGYTQYAERSVIQVATITGSTASRSVALGNAALAMLLRRPGSAERGGRSAPRWRRCLPRRVDRHAARTRGERRVHEAVVQNVAPHPLDASLH
jgi:hypothetical protein